MASEHTMCAMQYTRMQTNRALYILSAVKKSQLNTLQKYVLREWLWITLAVGIVLMVVLMGAYLGNMINDIADGRMPAGLLGTQLLLHLPAILNSVLPLAGFIAVLWGLGRLYQDQEMAVMRSSGFGWKKLLLPLAHLTLPLSAILLILGLGVTPATARLAEHQLEKAFRSAVLWGLQPGQFHVLKHGELVIYAGSIEADGMTLRDIFINQRQPARQQVWVAKTGKYWADSHTGEHFLILEDGTATDMAPNQADLRVLSFDRNDLRLPAPEFRKPDHEITSRSSMDLLSDGDLKAMAEFQWRVSPAISVIILCLLAIPLAHSEPREGRGVRIILGVLVYVLYGNILYLCRSWVSDGIVPVGIGLWWVHFIFLFSGFIWVGKQGRFAAREVLA